MVLADLVECGGRQILRGPLEQIEQDRQRAERNLADTEYLAREVVALRLAIKDMATKDFIRAELRSLLEELDREPESPGPGKTAATE